MSLIKKPYIFGCSVSESVVCCVSEVVWVPIQNYLKACSTWNEAIPDEVEVKKQLVDNSIVWTLYIVKNAAESRASCTRMC